jgi:Double zinc ribbon
MDELDRLYHQVVQELAALGHGRLAGPVQVAELYQEVVPYRQFRNALRFDTYQDYEMALLRLLSGERGYVTVEPPEAGEALRAEAQAAYPDPGLIREFAAARAHLDPSAVRTVLAGVSAYAPPTARAAVVAHQDDEPERGNLVPAPPHAAEETALATSPSDYAHPSLPTRAQPCVYCGADLPVGRDVFYCPFCGGNVRGVTCPECQTELEIGWTFCITCGHKTGRT